MYRILHIPTGEFVYEYYESINVETYTHHTFGIGEYQGYRFPFGISEYQGYRFPLRAYLINQDKEYAEKMLSLMSSKYAIIMTVKENKINKFKRDITHEKFCKNEYEIIYIKDTPC